MEYIIDEMKVSDWDQVKNIYIEGIKTGIATFQSEEDLPTWEIWNNGHINSCRIVARCGDDIFGWAALNPYSSRSVYSGVAEVSIYVGEKYKGLGIGTVLLENLVVLSEINGFWTLQAGITRENNASIAIHKKCEFREVGIRERIGKMKSGKWHDTVLMERRSSIVGID